MGVDTQFLTQVMPQDTLSFLIDNKERCKVQVAQVISDTEVRLTKKFPVPQSVQEYQCMPHIEQEAVYQAVHDELNKGGCIVIFPEGGSHDRVEMLPLKGKSIYKYINALG